MFKPDFPDHICDVADCVKNIVEFDNYDAFLNECSRRSDAELFDADDLIFCMDRLVGCQEWDKVVPNT